MATFLHTMVRITDPERTRAFYEEAVDEIDCRVFC
jgi:catechol 2,3-dioxygenase-like lactoylglutathione lyase family enzyme